MKPIPRFYVLSDPKATNILVSGTAIGVITNAQINFGLTPRLIRDLHYFNYQNSNNGLDLSIISESGYRYIQTVNIADPTPSLQMGQQFVALPASDNIKPNFASTVPKNSRLQFYAVNRTIQNAATRFTVAASCLMEQTLSPFNDPEWWEKRENIYENSEPFYGVYNFTLGTNEMSATRSLQIACKTAVTDIYYRVATGNVDDIYLDIRSGLDSNDVGLTFGLVNLQFLATNTQTGLYRRTAIPGIYAVNKDDAITIFLQRFNNTAAITDLQIVLVGRTFKDLD